ncbi:MAG: hypothetical protein AMXMBFR13_27380 [Phycisphaerae bacterium]
MRRNGGLRRRAAVGVGSLLLVAGALAAEEPMAIGEGGRIRANSWLRMAVPQGTTEGMTRVEIVDPWDHAVWKGAAFGKHIELYTRDWADGRYTARFTPGGELRFEVATEYIESIRARCGLLLREIEKKRDADGMVDGPLRGVSNLLQRIITLFVANLDRPRLEQHLTFCERETGIRTASATARILGSGSANFEGYEGPYRPFSRERSTMFMPPDVICDFSSTTPRKMARWGYKISDINHLLISHSHADHFDAPAIAAFARQRKQAGRPPPVVHSGSVACRALRELLAKTGEQDLVRLDELSPGRESEAGEVRILPVRANHSTDSDPLCFIMRWRGATCYYGTDTTYPKAETSAALARERFDVFAHEITAATADDGLHHCDLGDLLLLVGKLRRAGAIDTWTRVVSIHQDVEGVQMLPDYTHHERAVGFECSYDGMPIPFAYRAD